MSALLTDEEQLLMSMGGGQLAGPQSFPGQAPAPMAEYQPMPMPEPPDLSLSEQYLNNQFMNPRRAMWAGTMMDLANLFGGWNGSDYGGRQLQGTGFQMMAQAKQQNREIMERNLQRKQQAYQQQLQRWQLSQPKYMNAGNDIMRIDPRTGQFSVAHQGKPDPTKHQVFGNAQSGYYRLDAEGNPVPLVGGITPPEQKSAAFNQENALRDDYARDAKGFNEQLDAVQRARDAASAYYSGTNASDKLAADKSLIYNFVKAHDPTSTVSAGEAADVSNAPGVEAGIRNLYNRVINGEALSDEQRRSLMRQIEQLALNAQAQVGAINDRYTGLAGQWGVNPGAVVINRKYTMPEGYQPWLNQAPVAGLRRKPSLSTLAPDPYQQQRTEELPTVPTTPDWNATITIPGL